MFVSKLLDSVSPLGPLGCGVQRLFEALGLKLHLAQGEQLGASFKTIPELAKGAMDAVGAKALLQHHWKERRNVLLQQCSLKDSQTARTSAATIAAATKDIRQKMKLILRNIKDKVATPLDVIITSKCTFCRCSSATITTRPHLSASLPSPMYLVQVSAHLPCRSVCWWLHGYPEQQQ